LHQKHMEYYDRPAWADEAKKDVGDVRDSRLTSSFAFNLT